MGPPKPVVGVLVVCFVFVLHAVASESSSADSGITRARAGMCASELPRFVRELLEQPTHRRALYGMLVGKVNRSGPVEPLYAHNAASLFTPASNTKIFSTGSLFMHTDATKFHYQTRFHVGGAGSSSHLCVKGSGDPSIAYADLQNAASSIVSQGFTHFSELVVDSSLFKGDGQPFPSSWEWDDLNWDYGAEPEALAVEENALTFTLSPGTRVGWPLSIQFAIGEDSHAVEINNMGATLPSGSAATVMAYYPLGNSYLQIDGGIAIGAKPISFSVGIINSTSRFAKLFEQILKKKGASVERIKFSRCSEGDRVVYTHQSPPLSNLMDRCLQISDNLYAEVFARTLGAYFTSNSSTTGSTLNDGLRIIANTLKSLGVDLASFYQVDGSGLSRHNMLSPESLANTLNGLQVHLTADRFKLFKSFLPLAGRSGSLINRFKGTPAEGKVWAKTGSMTGVSSLSGYAENANFPHQTIIFSIIVNGNSLGQTAARGVIDTTVEALVGLRDC